jgi:hypothetical protein
VIAYTLYVHFTYRYALAAVYTVVFIDLDPQKRNSVKETVYRAERTKEPAKETVNKDCGDDDSDQQAEFPGEQRTEACKRICIARIKKQQHCAAERSRGADIFTKAGERRVPNRIHERNSHRQNNEYHIFQIGKYAGRAAFFQLGRAYFIQ